MDSLTSKTIDVKRGFTYKYYTSAAQTGKQIIFLAHGWPDTAELWEGLITNYLVPNGYGIIAIDCLGFGGTSKPTDPKAYGHEYVSADIIEILDKEKVDKVVSVGHDWGSVVAQRLYNFYPDRVLALATLNVAYRPPDPSQPFDLDGALAMSTKYLGYGNLWYWKLFTAPDGPELMNQHIESGFTAAHGKPETWLDTLCKENGLREYVEQDRKQPVEEYATDEMRQKFIRRMGRDGFQAPNCYYRYYTEGFMDETSKKIPKENYVVNVPVLFWGGQRDYVATPKALGPIVQAGLLPKLKVVTVDAGHWALLAKPKELGEAVTEWLKEIF